MDNTLLPNLSWKVRVGTIKLKCDKAKVEFGPARIGEKKYQNIHVTNLSNELYKVLAITDCPDNFLMLDENRSGVSGRNLQLEPYQEYRLELLFNPHAIGSLETKLRLYSSCESVSSKLTVCTVHLFGYGLGLEKEQKSQVGGPLVGSITKTIQRAAKQPTPATSVSPTRRYHQGATNTFLFAPDDVSRFNDVLVKKDRRALADLKDRSPSILNKGFHEERSYREQVEDQCCICQEHNVNCALDACGHMCLCHECAMKLYRSSQSMCPLCREPIKAVLKVWPSCHK